MNLVYPWLFEEIFFWYLSQRGILQNASYVQGNLYFSQSSAQFKVIDFLYLTRSPIILLSKIQDKLNLISSKFILKLLFVGLSINQRASILQTLHGKLHRYFFYILKTWRFVSRVTYTDMMLKKVKWLFQGQSGSDRIKIWPQDFLTLDPELWIIVL